MEIAPCAMRSDRSSSGATLRQDVERLADEDELSVAAYVRRLIAAHVKSVGADRVAA
jgi:hypothetical protein